MSVSLYRSPCTGLLVPSDPVWVPFTGLGDLEAGQGGFGLLRVLWLICPGIVLRD